MKKLTKFAVIILINLVMLVMSIGLLHVMTASANTATDGLGLTAAEFPAVPLLAAGGPDNFGYTYQDEVEAFGPTYVFTDISGTGTNLDLNDENVADIPLPAGFDFDFYGLPLTGLRVSNNGAILVNPGQFDRIGFTNYCPLSGAAIEYTNLIAPWWDDWGDEGDVYWQALGAAPNRRLVIQWHQMIHFPGTSQPVTFQAILFETSNLILFQYQDTDAGSSLFNNGNSGTIGILADSTNNLQYETCNGGDPLAAGRAIRFQRSSITIVKDTNPNESQDFEFSGSSGLSSTFTLNPVAGPASQTFFIVPGNYAVTETLPSGWELSGLTCDSLSGTPNLAQASVDITLTPEDNLTCTFENTKLGSITIVKQAAPESSQQFDFTGNVGDFNLTDDGTLSNTTTFPDLSPDTYVVTETIPANWNLTGISCVGGNYTAAEPGVSIFLDPGEVITCTFANAQPSTIVIEKVTEPASQPQDFDFTTTVVATPTFTLNPGSGPASQTLTGLNPGTYVVTESAVTGWDLTGLTCDDPTADSSTDPGTAVATISTDPGETVTCTYTNTRRGTISVVKDAVPDHSQNFSFTGAGPTFIPPFDLDDDPASATPNTLDFSVRPGPYAITETAVSNWSLSDISCDDPSGGSSGNTGTRAATIDMAAGEVITCTFTNTADPAELTVEKVTDPAADPQVFTYTTNLPGTSSFTLSTGGAPPLSRTFSITPGTYSVSEDTLLGWDLTASSCSDGSALTNIDLQPGEQVTCTFTNTKQAEIRVDKVTNPAADPNSFDFRLTGGPDAINQNFSLSDLTVPYSSGFLTPGSSYNITETVPAGWDLTPTCSDSSPIDNVTLSPGEVVTCTFTNTKRGQIVVDKVTNPAGNPTSFDFTAGGGLSPATFPLTDAASPQLFADVPPGNGYSITETVPSNWTLSSVSCSDGSPWNNLDVSPGEVITCTFTNTADPGTLIIEKVTDPASDPQVFDFNSDIPGNSTFTLSTGGAVPLSRTFTITPGTYLVSEQSVLGWVAESSCSDGSNPSSIGLGAGETVTCTFTNTKQSRIFVDKVTNPAGYPTAFQFTLTGGPAPINRTFTLTDTQPAYDSNFVQPGVYSVTETPVTGWSSNSTCTGSQPAGNISLSAGEVVTCTFTNIAQPGVLTITKRALPADGTRFTFSVTNQPDFTLADSESWNSSLAPGTYRILEGALPGWNLSTIACDDPAADDSQNPAMVSLDPGDNVTCVFTNTQSASLGSITIRKVANPQGSQAFTFTSTWGSFSLVDDGGTGNTHVESSLVAGTYLVTETAVSGWDLTNLACLGDQDGGNLIDQAARRVSIDLDAGEAIVCTFTNQPTVTGDHQLYLPIIMKNNDGTPPPLPVDLTVADVGVSNLRPDTGEPVVISATLRNTTGNAFVTPFWVDLYLATNLINPTVNQPWDEAFADTLVPHGVAWKVSGGMFSGDELIITNLNPNDLTVTRCDNFSNFIPYGLGCWPQTWKNNPLHNHFTTPGTYYLYVLVDSFDDPGATNPNGNVQETDESNNLYGPIPIVVGGAPLPGVVPLTTQETELPAAPGEGRAVVRP